MPVEHFALRPFFALTEVVRLCLVQVDTLDAVTAGRQRDGVINDSRTGVRLAVPLGLAAEDDRADSTLYGNYRQAQFIDTVFTCMCLIFNAVGVRSDDVAQA